MIKSVKWNNHPVLGNLELDFSNEDGSVYNTIVLAGENGTGKTTILETLSTFLNLGSMEPFDNIRYVINDTCYIITPAPNSDAQMGFHQRKNEKDGTEKLIITNRNNDFDAIRADNLDIRHYGCSYSKARSGFNTQKVKSATTLQLDTEKYEDGLTEEFTAIKQLMVDIDTQDNAKWMEITKAEAGTSYESFRRQSKKFRFEQAFNGFFDDMEFDRIDNTDSDEKKILFKKHGREISIDSLSTGEKQIVFRGVQLLRNANEMTDGTILIDEPELSMHPKWQQKIMKYYRDLFEKDEVQNAQMIFATHSEYVLRAALSDRDNVLVVVLSEKEGVITSKKITLPTVLPTVTAAETNFIAFGIISTDYHIELYGFLQSKKGYDSIKSFDKYIVEQDAIFNPALHEKIYSYTDKKDHQIEYKALPTYIRNSIDHPSPEKVYTPEELETSINLLINLIKLSE